MTDEQELAAKLSDAPERQVRTVNEAMPCPPQQPNSRATDSDFAQWQICSNGRFRPGSRTQKKLPSGVYRANADDFGPFLELIFIASDDIIELPEPAHMRVLTGIRKFWQSKDRYKAHGLLYKRGVLLWGPPGGGKTVTVQLLMREIVSQHDGIVLLADNPQLTVVVLRFLRRIERTRPLIVVFEDVDETISNHGEHSLLAVLDGEHQTDNVIYIATTNYPERLGARIVNRPSRFDERIKIGMPSLEARKAYLRKTLGEDFADLTQWSADTEGLSIAHLRELVVACFCLDQEYATVLERLRAMEIMPKPEDGFRRKDFGLQDSKTALSNYSGIMQLTKH